MKKLVAVLCAQLFLISFAAGEVRADAQLARFVMVLQAGSDAEPDLALYGATREQQWSNRVFIQISDEQAAELSKHPRVKYLQRISTGEGPFAPVSRELSAPVQSDAVTSPSWASGDYKYDGAGNVIGIGTDYYVYDDLSRLKRASLTGTGSYDTYSYDAFGNLFERTTTLNGYAVQLIPANADNKLNNATYDTVGNQTSGGISPHMYGWDPFKMMVTQYNAGRNDLFIYDANDERIGGFNGVTSAWKWTIRDEGGQVVRVYESPGAAGTSWMWVEDFVSRGGAVAGSERESAEGGRRHLHVDHLGTIRMVTNQSGQAISRHDYTPFGLETTSIRQELDRGYERPNTMAFTGQERDFNGGTQTDNDEYLDYMHARYFESDAGRFLSVDPSPASIGMSNPQSWNRYAYVYNRPLIYFDPKGQRPCMVKGSDGKDHPGECIDVVAPRPRTGFFSDAFSFPHMRMALSKHEDQSRFPASYPNPEQCRGLKELLKREAEHGTTTAANMSSNTWGDRHTLAYFNNDFNGPNDPVRSVRMSNGDVLDLDWFTDIRSYGSDYPALTYSIGKGGLWRGKNVAAWEDPGERTAVRYIREGRGYSDIFTADYMDVHCK